MDNNVNETVVTAEKSFPVFGLISMILGILSIPCLCCSYTSFFALAFGVAAVIFAIVDKKKNDGKFSGFALAGFICGAIGVGLVILYFVIAIIFFIIAMLGSSY